MTYVDGALVSGFAAHVVDRLLARHLAPLLADPRLTPEQRAALESVKADTREAARRWEASTISADISEETPRPETAPLSEWVTTEQAATQLGVTSRRARQLAAGGLGVKVHGAWLLDPEAVRERRTGASRRPEGGTPPDLRGVA
ncbi:hypothetical protein ACIBO2_26195 [Nonomuraea sp. NPDC050022]|uniref:hypothetical protein n=1 Tax=Nonomuraea sp. NPDC050022 TaxID=3364358 RepID=UPI0037AF3A0C